MNGTPICVRHRRRHPLPRRRIGARRGPLRFRLHHPHPQPRHGARAPARPPLGHHRRQRQGRGSARRRRGRRTTLAAARRRLRIHLRRGARDRLGTMRGSYHMLADDGTRFAAPIPRVHAHRSAHAALMARTDAAHDDLGDRRPARLLRPVAAPARTRALRSRRRPPVVLRRPGQSRWPIAGNAAPGAFAARAERRGARQP